MKTKIDYFSFGIVFVLLLLLLPLLIKKYILLFFGTNELQSYYEVVSAITSGIAVIIAFISIREQKNDSARQNERLDYSTKVEALTQVIEIRKFLFDKTGRVTDKDIEELADLTRTLHDLSMKMIENSKDNERLK
jgi:hypothetical protein